MPDYGKCNKAKNIVKKINKNLLLTLLPVFFILLVWFIFSVPYFFQGKVPYPSTYQVNHFKPWSLYEKYWGPVKNNAMPDIVDQIFPWKHFTVDELKKGKIPLWNPYSFSGNPHLANFQSAVLSPFNLLYFVLPFVEAWSVVVLIQPFLAGIFMYLLMRELRISKQGSVIGSISFMFCGFIVVWMAYGTLSMAIAFLPLTIFAIERFFNRKDLLSLVVLMISLPLSFFSGHFQTSLYLLVFSFAFLVFKAVQTKKTRETMFAFGAFSIGFLLTAPQVLPSIELYLHSVRSEIFIPSGGIPLQYLVTIFSPDFFGNAVTRNDWFGYYAEWASFIGIIPLMLAAFAIKSRKPIALFLFFAGSICLLLALDTPVLKILSDLRIPVLSTSNPTRILVLFSFAFAALSGFGFDRLQELVKKKSVKEVAFVLALFGVSLGIIWILLFAGSLPVDKLLIAKRNLVLPSLLYAGAFGIIAIILLFRIKRMSFLFLTFILFVSFDSFRFAQKWMPFDPKEFVFPQTSVISAAQQQIGFGRMFGNLGAQVDTYYRLPAVEGYDPLYPKRHGEFIRSASTGKFSEAERSVVKLGRDGQFTDRALDMLGVNLIFHPIADTNQGWAYPVWKDKNRFSLVYQDDTFQLFRNNSALEKASLFYDYEVIQNDKRLVERFYENDFVFKETLLLATQPSIPLNNESKKGTVKIVSYEPSSIAIDVNTDNPALLFLSDAYYPGWIARVDGKQVPILRANYSFRAIEVPTRRHNIMFAYQPLSFKLGIIIAFIGLGCVLILSLLTMRSRIVKR